MNAHTLQIERLESRLLLSGDVTAEVDGGTLIVTGDSSANQIRIVGAGLISDVYNIEGEEGTTINGDDEEDFDFDEIDNIVVRMKRGKDRVKLDDFSVSGDLTLTGGKAGDTISIDRVNVRDDLKIEGNTGHDVISLDQVDVTDFSNIFLGTGNDSLNINETTFGDDLTIRGEEGEDSITLDDDTEVDGTKSIKGGPDNDTIDDASSGG